MNELSRARILKFARCRIESEVPLGPLTSFKIGGPAQVLASPETQAELLQIIRLLRDEGTPFFYLGLGTNILVSDTGFDGVVIRASGELTRIRQEGELICSGPAAPLLRLTTFAAIRLRSGMEPLSGIPGSVGGGLYMNAGAYGGEICDTFISADALMPDNTIARIEKSDVGFAYRSAPAFRGTILLNSRYKPTPGQRGRIYSEMRRVWKLRREKQPLEFPSAGSIFKRPPGDFAGRLIEAVGGKGSSVGGAMVPEKHAGIFINIGNATASDVASLVRDIRVRVYRRFSILLETEVQPVGFKEDPFAISL